MMHEQYYDGQRGLLTRTIADRVACAANSLHKQKGCSNQGSVLHEGSTANPLLLVLCIGAVSACSCTNTEMSPEAERAAEKVTVETP